MSNGKTRIARIRYNLEFSGYEAVVFIRDNGTEYGYPSFVPAPLDAEYTHVMAQLSEAAKSQHVSANPGMRSYQRRVTPASFAQEFPQLAA